MSLPSFAIEKKVTIVMVTLAIILLGIISLTKLPQEYFPKIKFPQITIVTDYVNAAPEEIETLITRPIEEAIGSVAGLKRIESVSREGRSTIIASFNWGQDIDFAALGIREKIDLIKERLPKESEDPVVLKFDPLAAPVMLISVNGPKLDKVRLKLLTEKMLKDRLEKVDGIASVTVSGGVNREILVNIDHARLQANHMSLLEVVDAIDESNVSYPAGSIKKGLYEYLIRTVGEFRSPEEIKYTVVGADTVEELTREDTSFVESGGQGPRETIERLREDLQRGLLEKRLILVKDIADVEDGLAEITSYSRYNKNENIQLAIQKQSNANTIDVVNHLNKELKNLQKDLNSRGVYFDIIYDHSIFIRQTLKDLAQSASLGAFFALIVLIFFLRNVFASILVVITIPLTILSVFFLMMVTKLVPFIEEVTINVMSLGGLALAIGMIVDTGIVVLENIYRKRQQGIDPEDAAVEGAEEVTWPVFASCLTTIAVFFPLIVFVPGIPGQMFEDLSWAIVFSQIVAMLLPLSLVTMLSVYGKVKKKDYKPLRLTGNLDKKIIGIKSTAKQNGLILFILSIVVLVLISTFMIVPTLEREVLPRVDQGQFYTKIDFPIGTRLGITNDFAKEVEAMIRDEEEVKNVSTAVGSEKSSRGEVKVETLRPSQALILVTLNEEREHTSAEIIERLRKRIKKLDLEKRSVEVEFLLQESEFAVAQGGSKPIIVEAKGYDLEKLKDFADQLKKRLSQIQGVINLQDDRGEESPETKLNINKKRAALYGISAMDISLTAKTAIEGVVATMYREAGREYDVRVRLGEGDRDDIGNIDNLLFYSEVLDTHIPLKEIAQIEQGVGPSEIRRIDQDRTITITGEISTERKEKDVLEDIQKMLSGMKVPDDIPEDIHVSLSGKIKEVRESFAGVMFAFILAIALVYMIMASQFESFLQPFLIMVTVPLSFCGAFVSLLLTGQSLNVISLLGFVLLGGIVVNNGIVLIEYMNQRREDGEPLVEAVWNATNIRTRPVLMTSVTTIIGMVPVAFGSAILRPLAITVMGGLFSSTILTLLVLPCVYILITRFVEGEAADDEMPRSSEIQGN